jgi:hypothetical protein
MMYYIYLIIISDLNFNNDIQVHPSNYQKKKQNFLFHFMKIYLIIFNHCFMRSIQLMI